MLFAAEINSSLFESESLKELFLFLQETQMFCFCRPAGPIALLACAAVRVDSAKSYPPCLIFDFVCVYCHAWTMMSTWWINNEIHAADCPPTSSLPSVPSSVTCCCLYQRICTLCLTTTRPVTQVWRLRAEWGQRNFQLKSFFSSDSFNRK